MSKGWDTYLALVAPRPRPEGRPRERPRARPRVDIVQAEVNCEWVVSRWKREDEEQGENNRTIKTVNRPKKFLPCTQQSYVIKVSWARSDVNIVRYQIYKWHHSDLMWGNNHCYGDTCT